MSGQKLPLLYQEGRGEAEAQTLPYPALFD